jgi:hypothetical protein
MTAGTRSNDFGMYHSSCQGQQRLVRNMGRQGLRKKGCLALSDGKWWEYGVKKWFIRTIVLLGTCKYGMAWDT